MRTPYPLRSQIGFRACRGGADVAALEHATVLASSAGLPWNGVHVEVATQDGWQVDDLMPDGHYLGYNLSDRDLQYSVLSPAGWVSGRMPPGTFWVNPEGQRFSLRSSMLNHFVGIVVDGAFVDSTMGRHYELSGGFAVKDTTLEHLMHSMIDEIRGHSSRGPEFAQRLISAFITALAVGHGDPALPLTVKRRLGGPILESVLVWIEANCTEAITLKMMAQRAGLSRAHFAREFKRVTGLTPWDHVVALRLARARELLTRGETICNAAVQCGFSDQAHLSRAFKRHFDMSPSSYRRSTRGV